MKCSRAIYKLLLLLYLCKYERIFYIDEHNTNDEIFNI